MFQAAIKGLVIFLARGVSTSYCTPSNFNKVFPPSPEDVQSVYRWNHVKLCVGFLYFEISYLFFFLLLDVRVFLMRRSVTTGVAACQSVAQQYQASQNLIGY